jgi:hypothetical protein
MEGIQFVVDYKGEKTAVIIDLEKHGELWREFYNTLIARTEKPKVVQLGGIWKGVKITGGDIEEAREELLKKLEEKRTV